MCVPVVVGRRFHDAWLFWISPRSRAVGGKKKREHTDSPPEDTLDAVVVACAAPLKKRAMDAMDVGAEPCEAAPVAVPVSCEEEQSPAAVAGASSPSLAPATPVAAVAMCAHLPAATL